METASILLSITVLFVSLLRLLLFFVTSYLTVKESKTCL